ncbi:MAG: hypothetical protein ACTJLK_04050 [Anaplasma sp.]
MKGDSLPDVIPSNSGETFGDDPVKLLKVSIAITAGVFVPMAALFSTLSIV